MERKNAPRTETETIRIQPLEPAHHASLLEAATEALRTGVFPSPFPAEEIPGQDWKLQAGDPDVDPLENEYVGDEMPGGGMPTPDQGNVDDIGRVYGLTDIDAGSLVLGEELIGRRDAHRWELDPRSKDEEE